MRVCLFETSTKDLEPLSLARPVFDLCCGLGSLADKQYRYFQCTSPGVLVRAHLADFYLEEHPETKVNDSAWLRQGPTILVNGRWLPPPGFHVSEGPAVGLVQDEVVFAQVDSEHLKDCTLEKITELLEKWKKSLPVEESCGKLMAYPWDLVTSNEEQICLDFGQVCGRWGPFPGPWPAILGPSQRLCIEPSARLDPMVVADTTSGPVIIDRHAVVTAFTRLEGPCYIGPGTHILGAKIRGGTSLGPQCRIGGEVEASIVHGHSNKYHDGFLGHSYLGEWINLGAGTHTSDLRNDYGPVSVPLHGQAIATGLNKVGSFVGDHSKTGLGTLLNTGTAIGAFCHLFPAGRFAPKYVPSFCNWSHGALREGFPPEELLETARTVMARRGVEVSEARLHTYRTLFEETAAERDRILNQKEIRSRRSA